MIWTAYRNGDRLGYGFADSIDGCLYACHRLCGPASLQRIGVLGGEVKFTDSRTGMAVYIRREAPGDLPFKQEMWMEYARYLFHVAATGQFFAGYQRRPPWWAVNFADNFGHEAVFV